MAQITVATISALFTTNPPPPQSYDDRVSDAQLQTFVAANNTTAGQDFHGFTNAQTNDTIFTYVYLAALNYSNKSSSLPDVVSPQAAPQQITFNRMQTMVRNSNFTLHKLFSTFATAIYNGFRHNNEWSAKYVDMGFTEEDRWVAFPCSNKIKLTEATPKLTQGQLIAANTNKFANIKSSKELDSQSQQIHSVHPIITMGRLPNSRLISN